MAYEVELKFDLEPGDVELAASAPMLAACPSREQCLESVYFDTKDGALRQAGFSLRIRCSGDRYVQTIKRKCLPGAGLFVRQEWEADVGNFTLDFDRLRATPLQSLVETIDAEALLPLIRAKFKRRSWNIDRRDGLIEVVLDEGEVSSGAEVAPIRELELELKAGQTRLLFELAEEIGAAAPLRLGVLSKAERGFALAGRRLGKPARSELVRLVEPLAQGEAFRTVAHACLRQYRLNEMVLLVGRDAAALHQARIALRRLRSALSLFRSIVVDNEYQALREELRWLSGQFGDARDADVMLAGEAVREDDDLLSRLLKARGKAYECVEAALRSDRARALMLRLALWIELGSWRFRARSTHDIGLLAARQLERQWRKVWRNRGCIEPAHGDELHRLRLDVKRLRYSAEFLDELYAKKPDLAGREMFGAALRDLQDRLGDLNDAEVAETFISRLAPWRRVNADRIRFEADAAEAIAGAHEALDRTSAAAGYWLNGHAPEFWNQRLQRNLQAQRSASLLDGRRSDRAAATSAGGQNLTFAPRLKVRPIG